MKRRSGWAALLALGTVSFAFPARADLAEDVARLKERLGRGGTAVVLPPRVLASREATPVAIPPAATEPAGAGCTAVAVLGAISTVFAVRVPAVTPTEGAEFLPSVAGGRLVVRCGASRADLAELTVEMRSPRGILEMVVAQAQGPFPVIAEVLPHRDPGVVPGPPRAPGAPPMPEALPLRTAAVAESWADEGAEPTERKALTADDNGAGRLVVELTPGCHRFAVLADAPTTADAPPFDIDAELAWTTGELAAADRTDSPDATLTGCTGTRRLAIVAFAGAGARGSVVILRTRTDIPEGLPVTWGPFARGRLARAFLEHRAPPPLTPPVFSALGLPGITRIPVELVPGECYLGALAILEGSAKLVSLTASAGTSTPAVSHTDDPESSAVLSFCTGATDRGLLEAEIHGGALVWALGLWPAGHRRLGEEAP